MVALAERSCTPCQGGVSPLTPSECASYLAEVPDWELRDEGRTVARRFRFPDYRRFSALIERREALDHLLRRIEARAEEARERRRAASKKSADPAPRS